MTTKNIFIWIGLIAFALLSSCSNYLDPYPNGQRTDEDLWKYPEMVQGLIGQMYSYIPKNYDNNEGAYWDCATDNAVSTSTTRDMTKFALNSLTTGSDPFLTYWDRDYKAIALANTFLKDRKGFNTRFLVVPRLDSLVRYRLQGEAFALRAWFEWDLLQKFGGKGMDGQLLGVPIVTEPVDLSQEVNLARNTYEECVKQILADCDSAYKYLPIAYRDYLVEESGDLAYGGAMYWARIDGITTRAIKSNVYLTWASPRFNPSNDISRWDSAAVYAKKVMDFKTGVDGTSNTANSQRANAFSPSMSINWVNPQSAEIVWVSQYLGGNDAMERMFYPGGFQGNGTMGATQELVDAFGMKNGYPITDSRSGYDPKNPYVNRDPRFYSAIFYNNANALRISNKSVMYTFEDWENGGKDAAGASASNSRTNYYIKKFVYMGLNWSDKSIDRQRHSKFLIRWEHMVLNFAEAANHVLSSPTNASKYGISPKEAIQYIRTRKTTDGDSGLSTDDPYLNEVSGNTEAFDALVKNERRISTCFEGMRFYDLRRWTTSLDELNQSVHGAGVTKSDDGSFTYDLNMTVEDRNFKSAYLPIPYSEMLRMSNLVQNEGWDSWK